MRGKLLLLFGSFNVQALHGANREAGHGLGIVIVENFGVVIIIIVSASGVAKSSTTSIFRVEQTLIGVKSGEIVIASIDSSSRVGNEMVSQMGECALHREIV